MCLRFDVSGVWRVWGLRCLRFDVSGVVTGTFTSYENYGSYCSIDSSLKPPLLVIHQECIIFNLSL